MLTAQRTIVCAIKLERGRVVTLCGVELGSVKETQPKEIVTCPLCILAKEREWANESNHT